MCLYIAFISSVLNKEHIDQKKGRQYQTTSKAHFFIGQ
jgi:hypothetical protein